MGVSYADTVATRTSSDNSKYFYQTGIIWNTFGIHFVEERITPRIVLACCVGYSSRCCQNMMPSMMSLPYPQRASRKALSPAHSVFLSRSNFTIVYAVSFFVNPSI